MATIVIAAIFVSGCSLFLSKETRYLGEAENRATQQEVQRELGRPTTTATTPQGDTVWVYEVRTIEPGAQSTWSTSGSWCDEYRLTFDAQGVLRGWTHKAYLHGGELMPISCNGLIGVQKPAL
jgi:hypothetical protein